MDKIGIILVNKPVGITSFDIIRRLRKVIQIKQLGHAGTLDPFASGLMQILVGKATKIAQYLTNYDKSYHVTLQFGIKTDTGDSTGKVIEEEILAPFPLDYEDLKAKVESLTEQVPPIYSAIKVNGQRAYKLARKAEDFSLSARPIQVTDFQVIDFTFPYLTYQCQVSKGTYIRSLSEQIAGLYQTIATTTKLSRLSVSDMKVEDAVDLDKLTPDNWEQYLLPIEDFIACPVIHLSEEQNSDFWYGRSLKINNDAENSNLVIVKQGDQTKGLAEIRNSTLYPTKVFK